MTAAMMQSNASLAVAAASWACHGFDMSGGYIEIERKAEGTFVDVAT
jgi:hypothetical protein